MRLRYSLSILTLLVLVSFCPAGAQPAPNGAEILAAWQSDWERSLRSVRSVSYVETSSRTIEGPRERNRFGATVDVRFSSGSGMDRIMRRSVFNGRRVPTRRINALDRRMRRAYGAGFDWVRRPPPMAARLAGIVRPTGRMVADNVGDVRAWRVTTVPGQANDRIERVIFWFAQAADRPRLLRMRIVGRVPAVAGRVRGGSAIITTDYVRTRGLDLPRRARAEVVIQQLRRGHVFTVLLNAETTYSAITVTPR